MSSSTGRCRPRRRRPYGGAAPADLLLAAYRARPAHDASSPEDELSDLRTVFLSDAVYRRRATRLAQIQTAAGGRAHTYLFTAAPFGPQRGAFHGCERFFLFDQLEAMGIHHPDNRAARDELTGAWAAFVADGEPGWPAYSADRADGTRQIGGASAFVYEPPTDLAAAWPLVP